MSEIQSVEFRSESIYTPNDPKHNICMEIIENLLNIV